MSEEAPITREMALRVGLAARALPEISAAQLLSVLDRAIGLPLREAKLKKLTPKALRDAGEGLFDEVPGPSIKAALAELQGEAEIDPDLPAVEAYADGDLPDSIRIAIASNHADKADGHFGSCARFLIYQVSAAGNRLVAIRGANDVPEEQEKNAYRAELIGDCQLLYVASIGGPAAAKVVRAGAHPIKLPPEAENTTAGGLLADLQVTLSGNPPPWLAKVMGADPEARVRFEREAAEA